MNLDLGSLEIFVVCINCNFNALIAINEQICNSNKAARWPGRWVRSDPKTENDDELTPFWWWLRSVNQIAPEKGFPRARPSSGVRKATDKKLEEDAPQPPGTPHPTLGCQLWQLNVDARVAAQIFPASYLGNAFLILQFCPLFHFPPLCT